MGRPMSRHLLAAGARVVIFSRRPGVVEDLAARGMTPADSPAAVAQEAETVILMVSDTRAVEAVLFGPGGVIEAPLKGRLIIDMGTTGVAATRRFAARIAEAGGEYVDAPVSGGTLGAEAASLTIMAGGGDRALDRARPILSVLGGALTHVGGTGAGQVAKAANQVIVGLNIGAVAEALALARRAGADPARVRQALKGGFADSRVLEVHGERMVSGDFRPGGKAVTQRKDMAQALELAAELGMDLPATRLNMGLYDRLIDAGGGGLDHAALIKVLESEAEVDPDPDRN